MRRHVPQSCGCSHRTSASREPHPHSTERKRLPHASATSARRILIACARCAAHSADRRSMTAKVGESLATACACRSRRALRASRFFASPAVLDDHTYSSSSSQAGSLSSDQCGGRGVTPSSGSGRSATCARPIDSQSGTTTALRSGEAVDNSGLVNPDATVAVVPRHCTLPVVALPDLTPMPEPCIRCSVTTRPTC